MSRVDRNMPVAVDGEGVASGVMMHAEDTPLMTVRYRSHLEQAHHIRRISASAVPDNCGDDIHHAPARGRLVQRPLRKTVMTQEGRPVERPDSEVGRNGRRIMGARVSDIWDTMEHQAQAAYRKNTAKAAGAGIDPPPYVRPYTSSQISVARDYAALVERLYGSGMKCSTLEAQSGGSGGSGGREEAIMRDIDQLRFIRARIGDGWAMEAQEGEDRKSISVRSVVDRVSLDGWSISRVLRAAKWGETGRNRKALADSLRSALDRMQGY